MPELPEVETTCRGIEPHIKNQMVTNIVIRNHKLRWPISPTLKKKLPQQTIEAVNRRGKYLLLQTQLGNLIIHLGMSGSLRILQNQTAAKKHDHVDINFSNDVCLRFNDPRRFGCIIWTEENPSDHPLLKHLGPEPLTDDFNGNHLYQLSRKRKAPIKSFVMNSGVVVGVGNIYANEALFLAGIHPEKSVNHITIEQYDLLVKKIKHVLTAAIKQGGTTLRDYVNGDGKPGYFKQKLNVYGRADLPCVKCKTILQEIRLGQRSTVFCERCQG